MTNTSKFKPHSVKSFRSKRRIFRIVSGSEKNIYLWRKRVNLNHIVLNDIINMLCTFFGLGFVRPFFYNQKKNMILTKIWLVLNVKYE